MKGVNRLKQERNSEINLPTQTSGGQEISETKDTTSDRPKRNVKPPSRYTDSVNIDQANVPLSTCQHFNKKKKKGDLRNYISDICIVSLARNEIGESAIYI